MLHYSDCLPHRDREKKTNSPPTPEKFKDFREPTHSSLAGNFLVAQGMCKNVQNLFTDYCYGILQGVIPGIWNIIFLGWEPLISELLYMYYNVWNTVDYLFYSST